jgi:hypothetical protein
MKQKRVEVRPLTKRTQHAVPSLFAEGLDLSPKEKAALSVFAWSESGGDLEALREVYAADIKAAMRKVLKAAEELVEPYYVEAESEAAAATAEGILASLVIMQNEVERA